MLELGEYAADYILQNLRERDKNQDQSNGDSHLMDTELIVRDSTRKK